jgi:hypothetical protein
MRLSVLALFIALPAAAYAAGNPKGSNQPATDATKDATKPAADTKANTPVDSCIQQFQACIKDSGPACCGDKVCDINTSNGQLVCFIDFLQFTLCTELNAAMHSAKIGISGKADTESVRVLVMMQRSYAFGRRAHRTHWARGCSVLFTSSAQCLLQ